MSRAIQGSPSTNVFGHLCHLAALSKEGKTKAAVDNVVLTIFAVKKNFSAITADQVARAVEGYFSLTLRVEAVQLSIDTHLSSGKLIRDRKTKELTLSSVVKTEIERNIADANALEQSVRDEWLAFVTGIQPMPKATQEQLWKALGVYMASAFKKHGAETIALLDPSIATDQDERESLSTYLDSAIKDRCSDLPHADAVRHISDFFLYSTPNRTKYIAQLLDGTFTYFALTFDQFTARYLKEGLSPLSLFLDTNFIFAILGISESPLKDVSLELIESIRRHNLPFKLYYHEETLREIRRVIGSAGDDLKSRRWQQSISRAAVEAGIVHGITRTYHILNAEAPIDPEVFLSKYEHIEELLNDAGLTIYRTSSDPRLDEQRHLLVAEYKQFVDSHRPLRPKPYEALNHDMAVWQTVFRVRKRSSMVFGVGAYFLTIDHLLHRFDAIKLRGKDTLGVVILSNQFMQLLRPFIPTNQEVDESFVEVFAVPEFRTVVRDYATTSKKVFSYLSTFADVNEETAVRILMDQVLANQLRDLEEGSKEFQDLIDHAIAKENIALHQQAEELKASAASAHEKATSFERSVLEKNEELQRLDAERLSALQAVLDANDQTSAAVQRAQEAETTLQRVSNEHVATIRDHTSAITKLEGRIDRYSLVVRICIGLFVALGGSIAIAVLGKLVSWPWLDNHPNRLGLYACAMLASICFGWAIADEKRRSIALGALILPILIAVLTMLGK